MRVRQLGERGVIGKERGRVGDRLRVEQPSRGCGEGSRDGCVVGRVDEIDPDTERAERTEELAARRSVGRDRGDDPIAATDDRGDRPGGVAADPAHRPQSAEELGRALEAALPMAGADSKRVSA